MATMYNIYKDGKPFSTCFTSLRNHEKIINCWLERWKHSHNTTPPHGIYTTGKQPLIKLDNYGIKREF